MLTKAFGTPRRRRLITYYADDSYYEYSTFENASYCLLDRLGYAIKILLGSISNKVFNK